MKKFIIFSLVSLFGVLNAFSHHVPQNSNDYYVIDCTCNGTGKCYQCGGSGVVYFMYMANYCPICLGTGKCGLCHGAGKRYVKKQQVPVPSSGNSGGGYSGGSSSSSSSSSSNNGRIRCKYCNGTGRHPRCNGTGWDVSTTCASCNGSGKCGVCHGNGWYY